MTTPQKLAAVVLAAALPLAACGSESPHTTDSAAALVPFDEVKEVPPKHAKVSANDATVEEIKVAIAGAGVADAGHWATEIVAARPYDDAGHGFPKLRGELAKEDPPAGTVDKIVAILAE